MAGQSKPDLNAPSFGAIVSKLKPPTASVPAHVWLQKFGGGAMPPEQTYLTGGPLGPAHAPLLIGTSHDDNLANAGYRVRVLETADRAANRPRPRPAATAG